MKQIFSIALALACCTAMSAPAPAETLTREQIITAADRLADAQLKLAGHRNQIDWVAGTFYAGLAEYLHDSPKKAEYQQAIFDLGQRIKWTPQLDLKYPLHADTLCIAMAFEEASVDQQNATLREPLQAKLDLLADRLKAPPAKQLTWWWCDALFMAPRGMARLSNLTGDRKYLEAMDQEWWRTTALLYDPVEHLFFRDDGYFKRRTKAGHKVFWSRGNGWVIAGLARTLSYMPDDFPTREKYVRMYKEMAARLAGLQSDDGTWRPSLLDPDEFPTPETSGTALDCFGIAWGINHAILNRETYLPVVLKAWTAMMASRRPDGLPGYVQTEGAGPARVRPGTSRLYASGGYLLSAVELLKIAPVELSVDDSPRIKISPPPMPPATTTTTSTTSSVVPGPTTRP